MFSVPEDRLEIAHAVSGAGGAGDLVEEVDPNVV
jgi:hypothetical protein